MAAGLAGEQIRKRGVRVLAPDLAIMALQEAIDRDDTTTVTADVDWELFAASFTAARPSPLLAGLSGEAGGSADVPQGDAAGLRSQLAATPSADRQQVLLQVVRTEVATVLRHPSATMIEPGRAFRELGFDSLAAVELRQRLSTLTGQGLQATVVFDYPTPAALAEHLLAEMFPADADDTADPEEERVRAALAGIPLQRLRAAGLVDALLDLADGSRAPDLTDTALFADTEPDSVADLDVEDLVQRALGGAETRVPGIAVPEREVPDGNGP
jgi:acyl carrier protein